MNPHWAEAWIGREGPHCAALVEEVAAERFGARLALPQFPEEVDPARHSEVLASLAAALGRPVRRPREGDALLMRRIGGRGEGYHAGVCAILRGRVHVLHRLPGRGAHLHDIPMLRRCGYEPAGWYRLHALDSGRWPVTSGQEGAARPPTAGHRPATDP